MKKSQVLTGISSVVSFLLVSSSVAMNTLLAYSGTVNSALGIETSKVENPQGIDFSDAQYFDSEFGELSADHLQQVIAATYEHSVTEQQEGSVLLSNKNGTLPLNSQGLGVTLFGHAVAQPLYKAASAGPKGHKGEKGIDFKSALEQQGFQVNPALFEAYQQSPTSRGTGAYDFKTKTTSEWLMGEEPAEFYTDQLKGSWTDQYNDVALVMLAREGGEGIELYTQRPDDGKSQLALTEDEEALLKLIKDSPSFSKTVLLVNSGWPMELDWLEEYGIDACLWIGMPGQRGFEGVADILAGETNPSGRLTDTYAVDSLSSPAVVNGSYNDQQWTNKEQVIETTGFEEGEVANYTVQAEGIYVGYKYYETRYEDSILNQGNAASQPGSTSDEVWRYQNEVLYPFGYGLSYTTFDYDLENVTVDDEDTIKVQVKVTNTGQVAGKAPVQIYAQTPYGEYEKANKVEKSAIQLLAFDKTDLLDPGASQSLTIEGDKYLLASYDYTKEKGYVLSQGDYYIAVGADAHEALNNVLAAKGASGMVDHDGHSVNARRSNAYRWHEDFDAQTYKQSRYTEKLVTNQFDEAGLNYWIDDGVTYLSRSDWAATYPVKPVQVTATEKMIERLKGYSYEKPADAPSVDAITLGDNQGLPLAGLIGLSYDDPLWDEYLNQYTLDQLSSLVVDNFGTQEIAEVGKPAVIAGDGPDGPGGTFTG